VTEEVLSFCLVSTGVADGLQDVMPARSMISEAYVL